MARGDRDEPNSGSKRKGSPVKGCAKRMHPCQTVRACKKVADEKQCVTNNGVSVEAPPPLKRRGKRGKKVKKVLEESRAFRLWQGPLPDVTAWDNMVTVRVDFDALVAQWADLRELGTGEQHERFQREGVYEKRFEKLGKAWSDVGPRSFRVLDDRSGRLVFVFLRQIVPDEGVRAPARSHMGGLADLYATLRENRKDRQLPSLRVDGAHECRGPCDQGQRFMVGYTVARDRVGTIQSCSGSFGKETVAANAKAIRGALAFADRLLQAVAPDVHARHVALLPRDRRLGCTAISNVAGCVRWAVLHHWDRGDPPKGLCGSMPLGVWLQGTGRLLLWTLGIRVDARDGDFVFF